MENKTSPEQQFNLQSRPAIAVLYIVIFILGFLGNGLVIIIISRFKAKQRVADIYIKHLASADLLFVLTLPLWATQALLEYHWPFGKFLCKVVSYVVQVNMYASIFFLAYLSFDRYRAIVRRIPQDRWHSRRTQLGILGAIWLLSIFLATPTLIFRTTSITSNNYTSCDMDFSPVASTQQQKDAWTAGIRIFRIAMGFLLPCLSMTVCYAFIAHTLNHHFRAVHDDECRRRRLLKIIIILVVVFVICWAPFHVLDMFYVLSLLQLTSKSILESVIKGYIYATCLGFINSCLNPFLYAFFDQQFRTRCLQLLWPSKYADRPVSSLSSQVQHSGDCSMNSTM